MDRKVPDRPLVMRVPSLNRDHHPPRSPRVVVGVRVTPAGRDPSDTPPSARDQRRRTRILPLLAVTRELMYRSLHIIQVRIYILP